MGAKGFNKGFSVSWDQLHRDGRALASRLTELSPFEGLVSIARGGLVPAAIVARELEIRLVDTVCISSYEHMNQSEVSIIKGLNGDGEGWLIVDDLVDSGETIKALRPQLPKAHYATVYAKPDGRKQVDTFITEVSQDTWIYFPWDLEMKPAPTINEQIKK